MSQPDHNLFGASLAPDKPKASAKKPRKSDAVVKGTDAPIAHVVLPTPVDREFDYLIPEPLVGHVERGKRVVVAFGKRKLVAFVTGVAGSSPLPPSKLKPLLEVPDDERLADEGIMKLTRWMADYYACSWGEALTAVIPAVMRRKQTFRTVGILRLGKPEAEVLQHAAILEAKAGESDNSPYRKQAKVLRTVATFDEDFRPAALAESLGYSESPINTLRKQGWLAIERVELEDDSLGEHLPPADAPGELNLEQERALKLIAPSVAKDEYKTFLLKGVTGSGKTEVYIRVLMEALALGKSAIVLVPEIALTPQTVKRFTERLNHLSGIAVIHSAMTDKTRRREWKRIRSGEARVVIGPRSAVFAPVSDLGVIIVDEEHEHTYKQDNTPRYHARDVAVMRCSMEHAVCVLGSATPALESMHNAVRGRYQLVEMKRRVMDRKLPSVAVVDMSEECRRQHRFVTLSDQLIAATEKALSRGEQVMMFLNRRGYHSFFQCEACRTVLMCPNCAIPMSEHKTLGKAVCHYCYETTPSPRVCPTCRNGQMQAQGFGTERIEEILGKFFGGASIKRMDSDSMKRREDYEEALDAFRDGETDILVGTQMIAKGLDFPNVTVVGVIHADVSLHLADFRAQERTFQLLTQVAGRAGRGEQAGVVIVQTFSPEHACIEAARDQDYEAFFVHEMRQRKATFYPPFTRLLNVTVEARDERKGRDTAVALKNEIDDFARQNPDAIFGVLGPATAPFARIRGRHRTQILVKVKGHDAMQKVSERMRGKVKSTENLRVILDVDPYSVL